MHCIVVYGAWVTCITLRDKFVMSLLYQDNRAFPSHSTVLLYLILQNLVICSNES